MVIKQARSELKDRLWHKGSEFAMYQAKKILHESGITKPPFPPEHLAALRGIKVLKEDLGNLNSLVLPLDDSFEIKINAAHPPSRQNFSCAHEIAHTFFVEEEGRALLEILTREEGKKVAKNWEENLCDIAASEMLMPSQIFGGYASRYHFGIHALTPLSRIFKTSVQPTVLKLCDLNPNHCFVLNWAMEKSSALGDLGLHATWFTWSRMKLSSRASRFYFKPKLLGEFPSILKAYRSDAPTYSRQWLGVGNFRGRCRMESQAFGSGADRCVISLIIPESDN